MALGADNFLFRVVCTKRAQRRDAAVAIKAPSRPRLFLFGEGIAAAAAGSRQSLPLLLLTHRCSLSPRNKSVRKLLRRHGIQRHRQDPCGARSGHSPDPDHPDQPQREITRESVCRPNQRSQGEELESEGTCSNAHQDTSNHN